MLTHTQLVFLRELCCTAISINKFITLESLFFYFYQNIRLVDRPLISILDVLFEEKS